MSARRERSGFTLIELMIAIVLTGIVLGAMYRVLNGNQRFYRAQGEITELQQNLRAVGLILPAEFRELAASEGDIISMSATEIAIRAMRSFTALCAAPVASTVIVRNSLTFGYRAIDNSRDSLIIYADGDPDITSDDRWYIYYPQTSTAATCTGGSAGTQYTLTGGAAAIAGLASVLTGAPVRSFERVRYRVYLDGGQYWLGVETLVNGSYSAISPVAGPLVGANGISLAYYDATGAVTATAANVASIQIIARGKSGNQINTPGRPTGYYYDSIVVRTALRNN
jgi:prepilin-type N-terminal cleavage/methylation domain-containing protein